MNRAYALSIAAALGAASLCLQGQARADESAAALAFITDLYRGYETPTERPRRGDARWYDESLTRLLAENSAANADGVPLLSGDPLCNCMDANGLKLEAVKPLPAATGQLAGEASLRLAGDRIERIRLTLVRGAEGLRVWDIGDEQTPSLRQALAEDTASALRDKAAPATK